MYIYIYVCSICMLCTVPCPTDSCPKTAVSSHVTAATVLAVQVREYLKINVLGTIPYFVDGNVKILRHIQNSLTWDCAGHRRKTETSIIMAIVFMFTVWRKIFLNGSIFRIF